MADTQTFLSSEAWFLTNLDPPQTATLVFPPSPPGLTLPLPHIIQVGGGGKDNFCCVGAFQVRKSWAVS